MCDVHLVPDVDESRFATAKIKCGECKCKIDLGDQYRYIEGVLDDGSGERYCYSAHEDCYTLSNATVSKDGCFHYGGARRA